MFCFFGVSNHHRNPGSISGVEQFSSYLLKTSYFDLLREAVRFNKEIFPTLLTASVPLVSATLTNWDMKRILDSL